MDFVFIVLQVEDSALIGSPNPLAKKAGDNQEMTREQKTFFIIVRRVAELFDVENFTSPHALSPRFDGFVPHFDA
jgi:hypothetical protein